MRRGEKGLYSNFKMLSTLINEENYYISYGNLHAQKKGGWLADQISNDSYENQIITIKTVYHRSKMLWGSSSYPLNDLDKYKILPKAGLDSCASDFLIISSDKLVEEKGSYDYILIVTNQNEITIR